MAAFKGSFGAAGGSASWADDDDLDTSPLPIASTLPKVSEQQETRPESPRNERKYSTDSRDRDYDRRGGRGGYEDRGQRSERAPRSGGYDADRPKNPVPDHGPFKAYVGNLSFRLEELDIAEFLGPQDAVTSVRIQRDRETDRPKGFAYVEFSDREALVAALELDGQNLDGRAIRIDVAAERERKPTFFEKRGDRPERGNRYERRGPEEGRAEAPRERPRLALAPRTAETAAGDNEKPLKKQNLFGDAKPVDVNAYWERKQARDAEPKKERSKKSAAPRERKASHDEAADGKVQGRGRGGRGERSERGGRGGRGSALPSDAPPAAKKEVAKPKAAVEQKAVEPKMPKATKLPLPPSTKTKNAFGILVNDSDSD